MTNSEKRPLERFNSLKALFSHISQLKGFLDIPEINKVASHLYMSHMGAKYSVAVEQNDQKTAQTIKDFAKTCPYLDESKLDENAAVYSRNEKIKKWLPGPAETPARMAYSLFKKLGGK